MERRYAAYRWANGVSSIVAYGGKDGVFREVGLTVDDGLGSTTYDFSAQVELTGNPEQFGDEALTDVIEGLPLARTPEELALEGAADPGAMVLDVVVELPGGEPETNGEVFFNYPPVRETV